MPHVIEVAFKGNRKDFFLWEAGDPPPLNAPIIVEGDRGDDFGRVHATGETARLRNAGTAHGYGANGPTKTARRIASSQEIRRANDLRAQNEEARRQAMERIRASQLAMKLTDAEWQWDRKKLTLYFVAERRVDFRSLVRELATLFRTRIELRQIGVRDEAKRLDGIGRCGRQYCSAAWLPELRPVNLGVAKDQRLSLNPTQISGACGRLMCCLRYEHEFYVESRRRFPKEGKTLGTAKGDERVVANDIFRERVTLLGPDGEQRVIPLSELQQELEAAGTPLPAAARTDVIAEALDSDSPGGEEVEEVTFAPTTVAEASALDEPAVEPEALAGAAERAPTDHPERRARRRRGRRGGRRSRQDGGPSGNGPASGPPPAES